MTRARAIVLVLLLSGVGWVAASAIAAGAKKARPAPGTTQAREETGKPKEEESARGPRQERLADPAREAKAMEFLKEFRPDLAVRLDDIRSKQPPRYREIIHDASRRALELEEIRKHEPQEYAERVRRLRLRACPYRLAAEHLAAPASRREQIRKQLVACLEEIFEQRQREMEAELTELEERIAELREEVRIHQAGKAGRIQERVKALIGDGASDVVFW